ncbi:MAG TPA: GAF domain-containing protein [Sphingomicrobium sp.]|nr:GAF domain-containing protein [Sphingomicrobium sp.]
MKDSFARQVAAMGDEDLIRAILAEVSRITNMGFVAVARVTDERWIACQVADEIEFGLKPGDELEIQTTICNEIRQCGRSVVIDHVDADAEWRRHPVPARYGFQSYASFPIVLADGSFYGTLCAIDPNPRALSARAMVAVLRRQAERIAEIISSKNSPRQEGPVNKPKQSA